MINKYFNIFEAIAVYSFLGASLALIYKLDNQQYSGFLVFMLGVSNLILFNLINRHYKRNRIIIFNKLEIRFVGLILYMVMGLLVASEVFVIR
ncbi:hypothetical protein [Clostridium sp.]|uniref:hypothetical protein n=1 Tax=Clostridium sp. TaxID=1506 RepID=UPI001A399344|nr:hypothetical protein [Clostridium sp.]MBK5237435.1 hypothetical protein [Clostridium sp.]